MKTEYLSLVGSVGPGLQEETEVYSPLPHAISESVGSEDAAEEAELALAAGPIGRARASRTATTCDRCDIP